VDDAAGRSRQDQRPGKRRGAVQPHCTAFRPASYQQPATSYRL